MEQIIEVKQLTKAFTYYKKDTGIIHSFKNLIHRNTLTKMAVDNVSFSIRQGEMVGFLGPNGAGKSTTLKMLSGILHPTSGSATVMGYTPWKRHKDFKQQFSIVMGQKSQLWPDLPAADSIYLNKCIYQVEQESYQRTLDELTEMLGVRDLLHIQVRRLSLGERMKMELIASLIHRPKLLFLDEPTIGLDLLAQKAIRQFLRHYNEQTNATIILTSHYMKDIEDLCPRVILIQGGRITYDGELQQVNAEYGDKRIMKLQFHEHVEGTRLLPFGNVLHHDGTTAVIELDSANIADASRQLLELLPVSDVLIAEIGAEEGIEALFQRQS
ncbi:ABC transporter ATP-binding protein [Paenibacillus arenosi]|uniref:ATP-binding cassette domain-containing protein n=1 Tax=Paenibacillus arenosi TaxID=2774142 RepID=A0ABR9ASV6_9BACL|nr:ATP-binding cassette domain-containing protein [Paenibacillus arenosi]MBD8497193.1 ATP-binding cassette domain-containing protein [Paenibacillus arenosi]